MKIISPSEAEIENTLSDCAEIVDTVGTKYPGMAYEQGISDTIRWILGEDTNPMDN